MPFLYLMLNLFAVHDVSSLEDSLLARSIVKLEQDPKGERSLRKIRKTSGKPVNSSTTRLVNCDHGTPLGRRKEKILFNGLNCSSEEPGAFVAERVRES